MDKLPPLVETTWLNENLDREDIVVLDCSWHLPTSERDARKEFALTHIPGARFFDIDDICDKLSRYPHMLPDEWVFSEKVTGLGIHNETQIICYDVHGLFSAARVWWMFRVLGHEKVSVLNGGFKKWKSEAMPTNSIRYPYDTDERFHAVLNKDMIVNYKQIVECIEAKNSNILDARPKGRFSAMDPEPRKDLSSGHMPGAKCLPYSWLLDANGCLKSVTQLRTIFEDIGFDPEKPIVTTCGSGVTAAVLSFALYIMGYEQTRLYDGSWTEYAKKPNSVIMKF